jgi:galactosamine-6-phosphate isomerase
MLRPHVFSDHEAVSRYAADWLIDRLRDNPRALVCLASGTTPTRTYQLLAQRREIEPSLFNQCRILKLDEWGGLPAADPATCDQHLRAELITPLGLADRYVGFESNPADAAAECARIATWLEQNGPIDTCVLGLGVNGHLGFNEPAEFLQAHAHVAQLSSDSLAHAMLSLSTAQPVYGLTLGMADLLQAKNVILLVTGTTKREAFERLLTGHITAHFPASLLHTHPRVQLLCDAAAVSA